MGSTSLRVTSFVENVLHKDYHTRHYFKNFIIQTIKHFFFVGCTKSVRSWILQEFHPSFPLGHHHMLLRLLQELYYSNHKSFLLCRPYKVCMFLDSSRIPSFISSRSSSYVVRIRKAP
eukprot:TRINITY_DN1446_c0_g2_i1.p1 TRINITY_DN1446_c0_g2~~TRINITY_DN1446_c0_g2_i1.p1  ORF type:complete len:118 (+),score=10.72 TRINITY_DN1446_c0_g2_i1:297-650(+)